MTVDEHMTFKTTLLDMEELLALLRQFGLLVPNTPEGYALGGAAERVEHDIQQSRAILRRPHILGTLTTD